MRPAMVASEAIVTWTGKSKINHHSIVLTGAAQSDWSTSPEALQRAALMILSPSSWSS
jgi:hypothetical protein